MKVVDATSDTYKKMGGLYVIVNNTSIALPVNFCWLQPKAYKDSMILYFYVPVEITYGLLPLMKKKIDRVINIKSVCGMVSLPTNAAYCVSKHTLEPWSDCLRCEMQEQDVKFVVIQFSTMKTQIDMKFSNKYRNIFLAADPKQKLQYDNDKWIKTVHQTLAKSLEDIAENPMVTANDLM